MAIASVLVGSRGTSSGSTVSTTAGTSTASGSHFVLAISWDATQTISSVSDSKSNTYSAIGSAQSDGNGGLSQFYVCYNGTGGASHSATVNFSGTAFPVAHLIEVTGASASPQDQANQTLDSSSPFTITTGTLAQAAELILTVCACNQNSGAGSYSSSNATILSQETNTASFWTSAVGYIITASTSAVTPSWTFSTSTGGAGVLFLALKEAGSGPTLTSPTPSGTIATDTTATIGATTDTVSGTFYAVVDTSANLSGVTATQIKAGQKASGSAALASDSNAVAAAAVTADITGLSGGTNYAYAAVQNDGSSDSNVVTGTFRTAYLIVISWFKA